MALIAALIASMTLRAPLGLLKDFIEIGQRPVTVVYLHATP
jgi:hypothetical protein